MPPPPPHHRARSASFIDEERLARLLEPWVPDASSRKFVVRCLIGEGPVHHRGANYVLLALLGEVLERLGGAADGGAGEQLPVRLRLPPHLEERAASDPYPLSLPAEPLTHLADRESREFEAMVECLVDGPPQHALANAAMVCLLQGILSRLERKAP